MPNPYGGNIGFGPYGAEQSQALRKQRIAEMLMKQGMQAPQAQQGGRFAVPISPLQGLAQVLSAGAGGMMDKQAGEQASGIAQKQQADRAQALARALQQAQGSPQPDASMGGGPAMPADPMGAANTLAGSQDPMLAQAGIGMVGKGFENMLPQRPKAPEPYTLSPGAQRFGTDNKMIASVPPNPSRPETERPYFSPVQTAQGVYAFNGRTGKMELIRSDGQPVVGAVADPTLQGKIAGAKKEGAERAEAQVGAEVNLPQTIAKAEQAVQQIDDLIKHPGFGGAVGATWLPGARFVEGSSASDFMRRLDQIKGGAFLQAFETLKGGGQITEVEGKKATEAITRMDKSQSENEFKAAAKEFKDIIKAGVDRAKVKAAGGSFGRRAADNAPAPGTIMQGYRFKGGNPADRSNWEKAN